MEQITKPHCGARLDRLPDCRWHSSMFAIVAFGLLVCWSNAVGEAILAQLKALGWTDNSTTATFSAITTAGMFLGALVGGIIGDKTGRRNAFILYEAIHIASMVVGAFSPNMDFLIACRFVMGVGLGALLVTLFAGFTEYMPGRNRGTWSSRVSFIGNWSYPLCSLIAMGLTPLISAEWNWRVQLLILQYCHLSLRRWHGATFLNPALAGIARTLSGSRESHAEYRRRRHTPDG